MLYQCTDTFSMMVSLFYWNVTIVCVCVCSEAVSLQLQLNNETIIENIVRALLSLRFLLLHLIS